MKTIQMLEVATSVALDRELDLVAAFAVEFVSEPVDLANGWELVVDWGSVGGMNDVRVDAASLAITRTVDVQPAPKTWNFTKSGDAFDITVQDAPRVRSLTLEGLPTLLDRLIVVSLPGGMPLYTAPAVKRNGVIPQTFIGASISGNVLTLPDLAAAKVRLALVKDSFPEDAAPQLMTLTGVSGRGATLTSDLVLTQDGASVWSIPGEMPAAKTSVDLRFFIENAFKAKAKAGEPLITTFRLSGKGKAGIAVTHARGAVIRKVPSILTTELAGEAVTLPVPAPPLAPDTPSRVIADVTIAYHGMRLQWRDDAPQNEGGIAGLVVGETAVARRLPPQAFDGMSIAKIGVIGRAPVDCELVVQLLDANTNAVLLQPSAIALGASNKTALVWFDVPQQAPFGVPLAIAARMNHGRFLWAANPDPLLRIAVYDDDAGNLPVLIGGSDARQKTLSGVQFASTPPRIESDLFATIDVSDLTLEYGR